MAKIRYTYVKPTVKNHLEEACNILNNGGVIAYPTDVNWAFGCSPNNKEALGRLRLLKPNHPKERPFTLVFNGISMLSKYVEIDNFSYRVLKSVFPGKYTVILKRGSLFPKQMKDKRKEVGVRIPKSPLLFDLISLFGKPLVTSSVPDEGLGQQLYGYDIDSLYGNSLDLIFDLGLPVTSFETTIIDICSGEVSIVREGSGDHHSIVVE